MKNEMSFMQYISDVKTAIASSMSITLFSLSHIKFDFNHPWYVVDSWAEVGVIVGIVLSVCNFIVYLYGNFRRREQK